MHTRTHVPCGGASTATHPIFGHASKRLSTAASATARRRGERASTHRCAGGERRVFRQWQRSSSATLRTSGTKSAGARPCSGPIQRGRTHETLSRSEAAEHAPQIEPLLDPFGRAGGCVAGRRPILRHGDCNQPGGSALMVMFPSATNTNTGAAHRTHCCRRDASECIAW